MEWWEKVVDTASGVFDKYVDYENAKTEADALKTIGLVGTAQAAEPAPQPGFLSTVPVFVWYGAIAVGAILLLRR